MVPGFFLTCNSGNEVERTSSSNSQKSAMENLGIKLMNTLNPKTDQHKFPPYNIKTYCMATIVRRLCSCDDRALLAWCPRHIQSVFNLIVGTLIDIHAMVD